MVDLRKEMTLLARNEGVWEGWYRYYDCLLYTSRRG